MKNVYTRSFESAPPPRNASIERGFTLAEVLITLGIIGIVAAITMPNIIRKNRNKVLEIQFKTAYSIIQQASYQMYMENEGDFLDFLGYPTGGGYITQYLKKYAELAPKYYKVIKNLDRTETKEIQMYTSNGNKFTYNGSFLSFYPVILSNGMLLSFSSHTGGNIVIYVDTNGPFKKPNRYGYDLFRLEMTKNAKIIGDEDTRNDTCNLYKDKGYSWDNEGTGCGRYAISDKFPHDNTKNYWNNLP